MFKYTSKLAIAALAFLGTEVEAANGPGFGFSLNQEGLNEGKDQFAPIIFDKIQNLTIPEVDFDGGKLKNILVQIPQPALSDINIVLDSTQNGLELIAKNMQVSLDSDFTFKYIVSVSGKADIKIKKVGIDFEFDLGTQAGNPAYELAPMLKVSKTTVNLNSDDIDIKLTGGLVSKVANVLIPLIKSSVIPQMIKTIQSTIESTVTQTVDPFLKQNATQQVIPYLAGVTFDFAQMGKGPVVAGGVLQAGLNGTFFNSNKVQASAYTPAAFALRDAKGKQFQAYLTDYFLNTAFESGFSTGNTLDITYLLENYLNLTVTTDNLGLIVPELLAKYGAGKAVGISGRFTQAPSVSSFSADGQSFQGSLEVFIKVGSDTAIQAEFDGIDLLTLIYAKDGALYGSVSKSSLGTITNFQTTLGLTADQVLAELQGFLDKYVSQANAALADGIVIPKVFGFDVSDVEISNHAGYLELGFSVSPQFFEAASRGFRFMQGEFEKINQIINSPVEFKFLQA